METVDFIRNSLSFAHRALADACNGTPKQLHFVPEHGSHSIAWCLWHTARIEDLIINARSRQAPQVWNEDWANRTGLPFEGMGTGMSDDEASEIRIEDIDAFRAYQEAVWKQTEEYLSSITDEDLQSERQRRDGGIETIGQGISLHMLGHFNGHRGEINMLRGMQGMPTVLQREGTH
ncbi:MAG TPA: DinB family protein [Dehalococcoidia bacterium]|nr:DinB family protein [Dehalococcoidia bacterium]